MIELDDISIRSGSFELRRVSLSIPAGSYAVLMGATGQGKTTILEAICGLRTVTGGRVLLGGVDVTRRKPADRGVGYVPQDLALFPMMTVRGHLEFALRVRRWPAAAIGPRVTELAQELGIEPLLARDVRRLSGGEAQRVALGRALSFRPQVLLMDEPLNALDEATRDRLCELLGKVQSASHLTTLHVTHSRAEARALADRLIVLEGGQLYERPVADLEQLPDEMLEGTPRR
ncbi:MAG TPA: ATP-binding cassette domain-containing protein [Pirellulaceae bacterium]|nr:ATP-binding cassette domain-containing protein [Pirellulaceae bacterium]